MPVLPRLARARLALPPRHVPQFFDDGSNNDVYTMGTLCYSCLVWAMWYRGMFICWTFNSYARLPP